MIILESQRRKGIEWLVKEMLIFGLKQASLALNMWKLAGDKVMQRINSNLLGVMVISEGLAMVDEIWTFKDQVDKKQLVPNNIIMVNRY